MPKTLRTDNIPADQNLIGEWAFRRWTKGLVIGLVSYLIVGILSIAAFGAGLFLLLLTWPMFGLMLRAKRSKCVRVYPDRVELLNVFLVRRDFRIEASKIEAVSFIDSLLGKSEYGAVTVTGSGGTKALFLPIENQATLVEAIRNISSAPSHKQATPSEPIKSESETKICPFCAEEIKPQAIKCKHCGSDLSK